MDLFPKPVDDQLPKPQVPVLLAKLVFGQEVSKHLRYLQDRYENVDQVIRAYWLVRFFDELGL